MWLPGWRAECHCCRVCLGSQLESSRTTVLLKKKRKKKELFPSFRLLIKVLGKKTTKLTKCMKYFWKLWSLMRGGFLWWRENREYKCIFCLGQSGFIVFVANAPSVELSWIPKWHSVLSFGKSVKSLALWMSLLTICFIFFFNCEGTQRSWVSWYKCCTWCCKAGFDLPVMFL